MKTVDWKRIRNMLEAPSPDELHSIVSAKSIDDAHAQCPGIGRDSVRALRKLASELSSVSESVATAKQNEAAAGYAEVKELLRIKAAECDELQQVIDLGQECARAPLIVFKKDDKLKKEKHFATAHSTFSDPHGGLAVTPDSTLGLNVYDLNVLTQRLATWARRTVSLTKLQQSHRPVAELHLWLLGDHVNNELHGGDSACSAVLGPIEATTWMTGAYVTAVLAIASGLPDVKIIVHVKHGNHDRITQRMQSGRAFAVSLAHAIGYGLRYQLDGVAEVITPKATMVVCEMPDGFRLRVMHGHQFKYNKGISGPEASIRRAIPRMNRGIPADSLLIGHMHSQCTPGDVLMAGSACGTTPFAIDGTYEHRDPEQIFFVTDTHFGLTGIYRIPLHD